MDDTTLFRVVLHFLVVFTEQLFAALVSSGGNSRLPLAALHNRNFVVWTGYFIFLLPVIDGVAFYHLILGKKKAGDLFQISCLVCRCIGGGYLVIKHQYFSVVKVSILFNRNNSKIYTSLCLFTCNCNRICSAFFNLYFKFIRS